MPAQQLGRMAPPDQLALAQRIGRGGDDEQRAGNAEPASDPQHIEQVQRAIQGQRRQGQ
jgi:hypothetical protein